MRAVMTDPEATPWSAPGRGPAARTGVAVIHGFTASPQGTRPLGLRLAAVGYRVEVPCLPGHGTTTRDLARTRYRDWAAAVDGVVDDLAASCDRVVLVGHSMGGTLALDRASRTPELVDGVAVINPQVLDPTGIVARASGVLAWLAPYVPRDLAGLPTNDLADPAAREVAYAWVAARAARSLLVELPRIRRQLLDLEQPLLVVRSPQDHTVDPASSLALLELVASTDRRELVCERSYHVPQLDHDRERVEQAVLDLVADVAGAGS